MEVRLRVPPYGVVAAYLALPYLLREVSARVLGSLDHREFNLEYLLLGAVCVFLPRSVGFVLLLTEFLADSVYQICIVYQTWPERLLALQRYTKFLPLSRILEGAGLLLLGFLASAVLVLIRPRERQRLRTAAALLACLVALLAVDIVTGHNMLLMRREATSVPRYVRTPVLSLVFREQLYRNLIRQSAQGDDMVMKGASARLLALLSGADGQARNANVVMVMVESWGLANDPQLARGLTEPYQDPRLTAFYTIEQGTAPFNGATLGGEARELCQSSMGTSILHISSSRAERCLPELLRQRGYHDVSLHGFSGAMYFRDDLYPKLGFDQSLFLRDFLKQGLPRCGGPFPGICDAAIAGLMTRRLLTAPTGQPQFLYWVTLNSHLPMPLRTDVPDDGSCRNQPSLSASGKLCIWYRLVRQVHKSVASMAVQVESRPTVFLLVGDHAPPFRDVELRESFAAEQVPYILLIPKSLDHAPLSSSEATLHRRFAVKHFAALSHSSSQAHGPQ